MTILPKRMIDPTGVRVSEVPARDELASSILARFEYLSTFAARVRAIPYQRRRVARKASEARGADLPTEETINPTLPARMPSGPVKWPERCSMHWTKPQAPRGYLDSFTRTRVTGTADTPAHTLYRPSLTTRIYGNDALPDALDNSWEWHRTQRERATLRAMAEANEERIAAATLGMEAFDTVTLDTLE